MLIEMTVGDMPGVSAVKADFATGDTHVEFDPRAVTAQDIAAAINDAGYAAQLTP